MDEAQQQSEQTGKTTLGALGALLPVGTSGGRDMVAKPWRMREEKEIGALRAKMQKATGGEFVAAVVGEMFTRIADVNTAPLSSSERVAAVCKLPRADVHYAYVWLRRQALGSQVGVTAQCSNCGAESKLEVSLDDLDVRLAKPGARWEVVLRQPFTVRGQEVKAFTLTIPTWEVMRRIGSRANTGLAKLEIIRSSVVQVDQKDVALTPDDLDEMGKADIEILTDSIAENSGGPDFSLEIECARCAQEFKNVLDWGFDSFFSIRSGR